MAIKKRAKLAKVDAQSIIGSRIDFKKREFNFTEKQQEILKCLLDDDTKIVFLSGPAGTSKAQPLDSLVLTPNGFVEMGSLNVGDEVLTPDGASAKISGVFPQGEIDVYRVSFSDGTSTECCQDHLWLTQTANDRAATGKKGGVKFKRPRSGSVKNTLEIKNSLIHRECHLNHSIPITKSVSFESKPHVIHPYIMGVLLGDGCILQDVRFTSADKELVERVSSFLPNGLSISNRAEIGYCIVDKDATWTNPNRFTKELKRVGVFGHKSYSKFIPDEYLIDSTENRIHLLRGLMDTDGHVTNPRGRNGNSSYFTTVSPKLAENVRFLVESLGGTVSQKIRQNYYPYLGVKKRGADSFSMCINLPPEINPFSLSRKAQKVIPKTKYCPIRFITSIEMVGQKACQCIMVDSDEHLYMTNNFIVTHNTFVAIYAALHMLDRDYTKDIIYIRSIIESASRSLGSLPGTEDEKCSPFMMPLIDKCEEILEDASTKQLTQAEKLKSIPINFLRGASWKNKIAILDESQNCQAAELLTVLSRIGEKTKVIILGDADQSDLPPGKSGFNSYLKAFDSQECVEKGIFCFHFDKSDIVRSEILKFILERIETIPKVK